MCEKQKQTQLEGQRDPISMGKSKNQNLYLLRGLPTIVPLGDDATPKPNGPVPQAAGARRCSRRRDTLICYCRDRGHADIICDHADGMLNADHWLFDQPRGCQRGSQLEAPDNGRKLTPLPPSPSLSSGHLSEKKEGGKQAQ